VPGNAVDNPAPRRDYRVQRCAATANVHIPGQKREGVQWKLFATLAETADSEVTVAAEGTMSLREALDALLAAEPALEDHLLGESGELREHIRLLHEGEDPFAAGEGWETAVGPEDELAAFPPVSGG
jgi:molybdopterin synthase sulfur carrier subunit